MRGQEFGIIALFCLIIGGCSSNDDVIVVNLIDEELLVHVDEFERQAQVRAQNIDVEGLGIQVEIVPIDETNVAGVCYYGGDDPGRIEIDLDYWNRASLLQREYVVFHEMGHCVLNLGHFEGQYSSGICVSIMASGTGSCRPFYTARTRNQYLNDLFGSN